MRCDDALGREAAGVRGVGGGPAVVVPEGARGDLWVDVRGPEQGGVRIEREMMTALTPSDTGGGGGMASGDEGLCGGEDTGCAREIHYIFHTNYCKTTTTLHTQKRCGV